MTNRDAMIDQVYVRLVNAPDGLECSVNQVLAALGMMASAILREGFSDPAARQDRANWFCRLLQANVNRSLAASAQRH
jgi:uncharacterized protein YejL (UPF0352 family)